MTDEIEPLRKQIAAACDALKPWHGRFPAEIDEIRELLKTLTAKQGKFSGEHERLSIGIMGQVKAGKSSFLNALLFGGNPILPEAATPKTANLTRITWGETPKLTVTFYSPAEWRQIEAAARRPSDDVESHVARGLVDMARNQKLDIAAILESGEKVVKADDIQGLVGVMNDYVGENGKYTALVQMTELALPDEALIGYEIVDTPGMNDPVASRTDKTREYMATCDVVLFLSRCGQFLDQSDTHLLRSQLPAKGAKRIALVAGQMDGAIIDDGYDRASLQETESNIRVRLTRRADVEMGKAAQAAQAHGDDARADLFRSLQTPLFASTFAHLFATWPDTRWRERESMAITYENMSELADDVWQGRRPTLEDWERIGNFAQIRQIYDRARADKDALLKSQRDSLLSETQHQWQAALKALDDAVTLRDAILCVNELKNIHHLQKQCEDRIERIATKLGKVMDTVQTKAEAECANMCAALQKDTARYSSLKMQKGVEKETHSRTISTSVWYKPWTWGDEETIFYTVTRDYEFVAAADAIERLADYGQASARSLESEFLSLVSMDALRMKLREVLLAELDTAQVGFDAGVFRQRLEKTLNGLKLPTLSFDIGDVRRSIGARFSGEVRGEQIALLNQAVKDSLLEISQRLAQEVTDKVDALCNGLTRIKTQLARRMTDDIRNELAQLQEAFAQKEEERRVLARLLKVIERFSATADRIAQTARGAHSTHIEIVD